MANKKIDSDRLNNYINQQLDEALNGIEEEIYEIDKKISVNQIESCPYPDNEEFLDKLVKKYCRKKESIPWVRLDILDALADEAGQKQVTYPIKFRYKGFNGEIDRNLKGNIYILFEIINSKLIRKYEDRTISIRYNKQSKYIYPEIIKNGKVTVVLKDLKFKNFDPYLLEGYLHFLAEPEE